MQQTFDRREFTVAAVLAALSGVTITISSCGGGSDGMTNPDPAPSLGPGDKAGSISGNHGHTAVIRAAELTAGGAVNLNIQGQAAHAHFVQLSGAEVTQVSQGARVSKSSSTDDGHSHTVSFN
jgi:hypothetical protein